jgi:hypothetical protein
MSDPTLVSRPLNSYLQNWLAENSQNINGVASALGLDPTFIVGGPSQEASTIITESQTVADNGQSVTAVSERSADILIDRWIVPLFSSAQIASDYSSRLNDIIITPPKPDGVVATTSYQLSKLISP